MKYQSTADLREKEVVNICDGAKLGCPDEFEMNMEDGRIIAIVVGNDNGLFGFGKKEETVIPWDKIQCIGEDTIIVKLIPEDLRNCVRECRKKRKDNLKL